MKTIAPVLLRALDTVLPAVSKRHALPILSTVFVDGRENQITAMDLETSIRTRIPCEPNGVYGCFYPDKLKKLVKAASGEISIEQNEKTATFSSGSMIAEIATMDASDYPGWPTGPGVSGLPVSTRDLKRALERILHASGHEQIGLIVDGLNQRLIGTDGHRASVVAAPWLPAVHKRSVSQSAIKKALKVLDKAVDKEWTLKAFERYISIASESTEIVIHTQEPDDRIDIPWTGRIEDEPAVSVLRDDLTRALRIVGTMVDREQTMSVSFRPCRVYFRCENEPLGFGQTWIDAVVPDGLAGQDFLVNHGYVTDAVRAAGSLVPLRSIGSWFVIQDEIVMKKKAAA